MHEGWMHMKRRWKRGITAALAAALLLAPLPGSLGRMEGEEATEAPAHTEAPARTEAPTRT